MRTMECRAGQGPTARAPTRIAPFARAALRESSRKGTGARSGAPPSPSDRRRYRSFYALPRKTVLQQVEIHRSLDRLRARGHSQLLEDRPDVGFHRVVRDVKGGCDLQVRGGRQQLQDTQL